MTSVLCLASQAHALDLQLPDRLNLPARHYGHFERTAFLSCAQSVQRVVCVGERGVIVYSDNDGSSWSQAKVPISTLITSISAASNSALWAAGHSGSILFSADAGENWELKFDGRQANTLLIEHAQRQLNSLKESFQDADETVQKDLQLSIEDAEFFLSNAQFDAQLGPANPLLDVLFVDEKQGFAVGAYGLFVKTEDGGKSWQTIAHRLENFDRYHLNAISQLQGGTLIIAGEAGTLFASYDQGETWETLYGPYQGSFFGLQATGNNDEALLYGLKGNLFKTADGGQSWQPIELDVQTSLTASARSKAGRLVIVGLSGVILLSDASGEHFSRVKTDGFKGFNGVEFINESQLILASDEGLQLMNIE